MSGAGTPFASGPLPLAGFVLEIAGIRFRVSAPGDTPLLLDPDPPYRPFIDLGSPPAAGEVAVHIVPGLPEEGDLGPPEFDAAGTWLLHRSAIGRHIVFRPAGPGSRPLWAARLSPAGKEIRVSVSPELVREHDGRMVIDNPVSYPLDQLLLVHALGRAGLLLHAAGAVLEGRALALAGPSGAGKTTISGILAAAGFSILSDDRVAVRLSAGGMFLHGTPWAGEGGHALRRGSPLAGIFFLRHDGPGEPERMDAGEALRNLLPVASIPWHDGAARDDALEACRELLARTPAFSLPFAPGPEVGHVLSRFIRS